jgi:tetratricopeptide (TPR) repeat protein
MLQLEVRQNAETEQLKRSFCQVMTEKATQFSPLLTRQFFEEMIPIIPHLEEAVIQPMSSYLELQDLSLIVAAMVGFYDFNSLKNLEASSGGLVSPDGMVPISRSENRVKVFHYIRATYSEAKSEAKIDYLRAIARQDAWIEADPLIDLATIYLVKKRYENAKNWYEIALEILLKQADCDLRKISSLWNNLGLVNYLQGDYENAESAYQKSLYIQHQCLDDNNFGVAETLNNLGVLYCYQENFSKAEPLLFRVLKIHEKFPFPQRIQIQSYTMATQQSLKNMWCAMECASNSLKEVSQYLEFQIEQSTVAVCPSTPYPLAQA